MSTSPPPDPPSRAKPAATSNPRAAARASRIRRLRRRAAGSAVAIFAASWFGIAATSGEPVTAAQEGTTSGQTSSDSTAATSESTSSDDWSYDASGTEPGWSTGSGEATESSGWPDAGDDAADTPATVSQTQAIAPSATTTGQS